MEKVKFIFIFLCVISLSLSCRRYNTQQPDNKSAEKEQQQKEQLILGNQLLVEKEAEVIDSYIAQHDWKMKTTESGLRYMFIEYGTGSQPQVGKTVELSYTLSLLNDHVCYTSELLGNKVFNIGYGGVEPGLEEAVLLMHVGDSARLIMPSHLAHGLSGDGECIPRRSAIVYEVKLLKLIN